MNEKQLQAVCESVAVGQGFLYIDAKLRGSKQIPVIEVYIDGMAALSIDDCAKVSNLITALLDEEGSLGDKYRLEVSSPGIDRPLKFPGQFPKHIGRNFSVQFNTESEQSTLTGKLTGVHENELSFALKDGSEKKLDFQQIVTAKIIISFT